MMNLWQRLKLRSKFFVYFAGLTALIIMLISIVIYLYQQNMIRKQAEEKAFRLAKTLAYTSLNAILLDDYAVIQLLIDSMKESRDILSIVLLDSNGKVIAADDPGQRGFTCNDSLTVRAMQTDKLQLIRLTDDRNKTVWETYVPVLQLNKRIGTVRIQYLAENLFAGLFSTIAVIGFLAIILSVILSYYLARRVVKPITAVSSLARAYGQGKFDQAITGYGEDEIGQMIQSLNQLSAQLVDLINERSAHEGLIMIGEFASYIIHDLKNPLTGIHLLADGLNRRLAEDSPLRKYSEEILSASQKVEIFVRRTLDMAKATELNREDIDVNTMVNKAIDEVSNHDSLIKNRNFDPDIPIFKGDYRLLFMAVKNLIVNAVEATREQGEVSVRTEWSGKIYIIVSDSGCGIPKEKLQAIFRPFFSMKNQGHGLGLAMVKRAVNLHGGEIQVDSQPRVGSIFKIILPV
jgi:signal transduction histidine kinase